MKPTATQIRNDVIDALSKLGGSANDIADTLANKGIHGYRTHVMKCPLSNYLREQGLEMLVSARWTSGSLKEIVEDVQGSYNFKVDHVEVMHTEPIEDFVMRFDRGDYPELDASLEEVIPDVYRRTPALG